MLTRRGFIKSASIATLAAGTSAIDLRSSAGQQVANSTGTERPKLRAPANAADCHMHIYDPAHFPMPPSKRPAPSNAAVPQYRLLQKRIGTTRVVVVQPRNYALENDVTLDAIVQLGNARGVAVIHPTVSDAQLKRLNDGGIRGIRFTLGDPATAVVKVDMIEPLAKRIAPLGWHIQLNMEGEQIVENSALLARLPTQLVFDHLGNPTLPGGVDHPSHAIVRGLVDGVVREIELMCACRLAEQLEELFDALTLERSRNALHLLRGEVGRRVRHASKIPISITCATSLSPRPLTHSRTTSSAFQRFRSRVIQDTACADSSAGMIPSSLLSV